VFGDISGANPSLLNPANPWSNSAAANTYLPIRSCPASYYGPLSSLSQQTRSQALPLKRRCSRAEMARSSLSNKRRRQAQRRAA
jgi:hypothetical protein